MGERNRLEYQAIFKSVDIRAWMLIYQILAMAKNSKEEMLPHIEGLKDKVTATLKVIKAIVKKVNEIETNIYGISDKEIKQLKKLASGRKPSEEVKAKVKLYQIDPAKYVKDDKTVKPARLRWLRKKDAGNKQFKNLNQSVYSNDISESNQTELLGMNMTIGDDNLP